MNILTTGPEAAAARALLAHGAGAPMDTPFMNAFARAFADHGIQTLRFEFAYMASRRTGEGRKPPPKAERVMGEFLDAVAAIGAGPPLFIGGKSMGGRVASMVAEELYRARKIAGLFCLGYPFHPPGRPEKLRTAHLKELTVPTLICQGTRDPFGTREEVARYSLSSAIRIHWLESGDHDFRPEKGSAVTAKENLRSAADEVAAWIRRGEGT
jgi:predicted alpha/beta-hydrolase family hydrolase